MLRFFAATLTAALFTTQSFAVDVVDLAGRKVSVPDKVERIILGEGRYMPTLAILDRQDPTQRVVGMMGEFERLDPAGYARFVQRFPKLAKIPRIGRASEDSFSIEQAIALQPQVAIFGIEGHGPASTSKEVIDRLQAAGVAIVFIDFRRDPLGNSVKSMNLLGRVLGREKEASDFVAFYEEQMRRVTSRLASVKSTPTVFLESRVGLTDACCETMAHGMMSGFIDRAGGDNIAKKVVPGEVGTVNLEYLLTQQPRYYIGTAVGALDTVDKMPNRIVLGAGVSPAAARASLVRATRRTGIANLSAVREGRAFAIWHHFYNSPFNVAAVQAIAKWLHPEQFTDLDPDATLRTLYQRFQPFELDGTYWIGLK
ncbi:ABC transporter substrate-binding protein [Uliginosibacterium sp. sgz301328]|uniref:ABC transporter substrate-binding protein n=1 Tax=Uliginosibacterium sp. sgz301328 TaxID=3243764 RepID=UPI00359D3D2B